ncbi:MAG TPA: hypothetical protein VMT62_17545 [Syntrophorhabdaceae bacterium]|nr:hypothetical protein [Syntrophorhabdaceae bacterium]
MVNKLEPGYFERVREIMSGMKRDDMKIIVKATEKIRDNMRRGGFSRVTCGR